MSTFFRINIIWVILISLILCGCGEKPLYQGKPADHWLEMMEDRDPGTRLRALNALREIGPVSSSVVKTVIEAVNDDGELDSFLETKSVREEAIVTLGHFGPKAKKAVPVLMESLKQEDASYKGEMIVALGLIGEDEAIPTIVEFLKDYRYDDQAEDALKSMGSKSLPSVLPLLEDEDTNIQRQAVKLIGELEPVEDRAIQALISVLDDSAAGGAPGLSVKRAAVSALKNLGPEAAPAIPILVNALSDENRSMRQDARSALVSIGNDAVPALTEAVSDRESKRRLNAIMGLGEIGEASSKAAPVIIQALRTEENSSNRELIIQALGKIGNPAAIPVLIEMCGHNDRRIHQQAIKSLGEFGPRAKEAVSVLTELTTHKNRYTRRYAQEALNMINKDEK